MTSKRKKMGGDTGRRFRKGMLRGVWGERFAEILLRCKGYRILARGLRVGGCGGRGGGMGMGEIDLLVRRGVVLVIVEVKWRSDLGSVAYAIDGVQRRRLRRAGEVLFARGMGGEGIEMLRFDVVLLAPFSVRHWENAF